jgi:hypothetical protein
MTETVEHQTIAALRVRLLALGLHEDAGSIIHENKPEAATRNACIPQTIADQIWVMYEFPTEADRLAWEATLPKRVADWLDRKLIPHAMRFGWSSRDANGFPC